MGVCLEESEKIISFSFADNERSRNVNILQQLKNFFIFENVIY